MVIKGETLEKKARQLLKERGVEMEDLAELVLYLQKPYIENLDLNTCIENIDSVLSKREVHNTIITGIQLDILAEQKNCFTHFRKLLKMMKACMVLMKFWLFPS